MSNNAERIKFLKSARASIERDIASLEKRGGDSKAISGFKEKLAELDDQIGKAEGSLQVSSDAVMTKKDYKAQIDIAAKNLDRLKKTNAPVDRINAQLRTLDSLRAKMNKAA